MKSLLFILCAFFPTLILADITDITGRELPISIDQKGAYHYQVNFEKIDAYSTYYISAQKGKDSKDDDKTEVKLFLGGNCLESCSNVVSEPDKDQYCEMKEDFLEKYYLVKLVPNRECILYFSVETTTPINMLIHHQLTIPVQEVQTVPIMFHIPNAPVFLEYTPRFPPAFISQAKIYVDLAEKEDVKAVYFGKDSDYQNCNTHYPCEEEHCFAFELPSYEKPKQYFIAFSYVTVLTSNLYIAIYPANDQISETKVTIGFSMPLISKGIECPEKHYLAKYNEDTFCEACEEHCSDCKSKDCSECEKGYAVFKGKCIEHECECFEKYKDKDGKCVDCKDNCKLCNSETKCLECQEKYILVDNKCELKAQCKEYQYYNSKSNECGDCMPGCETCIEALVCEICRDDFYYNNLESACIAYSKCQPNQHLDKIKNECLDCSENCKKCESEDECIECGEEFVVQNGVCVKDCGKGKFYNDENKKCEYCIKNCKQCSDTKTCDVCKIGYYEKDHQCKESPLCKPGYYLTKARDECETCPKNCTSCKNESFCQSCKKGFSLVGHQMCAPSCQKYSFFNVEEQKCNSCIEHCEECMDESSCVKCRRGFSYHLSSEKSSCIQALFGSLKSGFIVVIGFAFLLLINLF